MLFYIYIVASLSSILSAEVMRVKQLSPRASAEKFPGKGANGKNKTEK